MTEPNEEHIDEKRERDMRLLCSSLADYVTLISKRQGRTNYKWTKTVMDNSTRKWARVSDELIEFLDVLSESTDISSREKLIGGCVAFAANHPDQLQSFLLEQSASEFMEQEFPELSNNPESTETDTPRNNSQNTDEGVNKQENNPQSTETPGDMNTDEEKSSASTSNVDPGTLEWDGEDKAQDKNIQ